MPRYLHPCFGTLFSAAKPKRIEVSINVSIIRSRCDNTGRKPVDPRPRESRLTSALLRPLFSLLLNSLGLAWSTRLRLLITTSLAQRHFYRTVDWISSAWLARVSYTLHHEHTLQTSQEDIKLSLPLKTRCPIPSRGHPTQDLPHPRSRTQRPLSREHNNVPSLRMELPQGPKTLEPPRLRHPLTKINRHRQHVDPARL